MGTARFYRIARPDYDSDMIASRRNPISVEPEGVLPGVVCPVCRESPPSLIRTDAPMPKSAEGRALVNPKRGAPYMDTSEWDGVAARLADDIGVAPEALSPRGIIGTGTLTVRSKSVSDFLFADISDVYVTERARNLIVGLRFSGVAFLPTRTRWAAKVHHGEVAPPMLWEMRVTGIGSTPDADKVGVVECTSCGRRSYTWSRVRALDTGKWDGSDFFTLRGTGGKYVTQRVRDAILGAGLTNVDFRRLPAREELEAEEAAGSGAEASTPEASHPAARTREVRVLEVVGDTGDGVLRVTPETAEALSRLAGAGMALLRAVEGGEETYILRATQECDCLEGDGADLDGKTTLRGGEYWFRNEDVPEGAVFFRVPQCPSAVLATWEMVEAIAEAGVAELRFAEVWDEDMGPRIGARAKPACGPEADPTPEERMEDYLLAEVGAVGAVRTVATLSLVWPGDDSEEEVALMAYEADDGERLALYGPVLETLDCSAEAWVRMGVECAFALYAGHDFVTGDPGESEFEEPCDPPSSSAWIEKVARLGCSDVLVRNVVLVGEKFYYEGDAFRAGEPVKVAGTMDDIEVYSADAPWASEHPLYWCLGKRYAEEKWGWKLRK